MLNKIKFGALRARNFRWYFFGVGISLCGSWLQYVALGWLIYGLSQSATLLGLNSLIGGLPLLILPPFLGSFIDKFNKRKLLLATQSIFFIQTLTLASLTLTHHLTYLTIILLSLLNGIIFSIDQPLRQALLPTLIDNRNDLPNAIAWNAFMNNFSRMLSPALAGLLIYEWGEGFCFLIDSISFLIMIFVIFQIDWKPLIAPSLKKPFWEAWQLGFTYIRNSKLISQSLLLTFIASSTLGTYTLVMPIIAKNIYHGDSKILGYLLTASGMGAIIASLLMTSQNAKLETIINKILLSSILAIFSLVVLVNTPLFWLGIVSIAILGGSMITAVISLNTLVQIAAEDSKRGMIMSFFTTAYLGAIPLSNFSASWLIDQVGVRSTMAGLCAIFFVGVIYFFINIRTPSAMASLPLKAEQKF